MKHKILGLILSIIMLCPVNIYAESKRAFINENELEFALEVVDKLEILERSDSNSNDIISRVDFAVYLARLFKVDEYGSSEVTYFTDIKPDHYALHCINYFVSCGGFDGYGDAQFMPDKDISPIEVAKVIFNCLGYRTYAELNGGYPKAYQEMAKETKLLDGFASNQDITRNELAVLLVRAGLINELTWESFSDNVFDFTVDDEDDAFSKYWDIYEYEGIVDGCDGIILKDNVSADMGYISINEKKARTDGKRYKKYLGVYSKALIRENDDWDTLIGIMAVDKKNTIIEIEGKDIDAFADNILTYYEGDKLNDIRVETDANIVYNGTIAKYGMDGLTDIAKGKITLIDTDRNDDADSVIIESYKSYTVDYVDATTEEIYNKLDGSQIMKLDNYVHCGIYLSNGDVAQISDITKYSVITVMESAGFVDIYISNSVLEGNIKRAYIDEYGRSVIEIDGKDYIVDDSYKNNATWFANGLFKGKIGDNYQFLLDTFGEVVYVKGKGTDNFEVGYVMKANLNDTEDVFMLKLFTADGVIKKYELAEKVKIDGVSKKDAQSQMGAFLMGDSEVILFKVDEDEKINVIDTSYRDTQRESKDTLCVAANEKKSRTWKTYNSSYDAEILCDASTIIFKVPNNKFGAEDYRYEIGVRSENKDAANYLTRSYKIDPDKFADSIVVQYTVKKGTLASKFLVIEKVSELVIDDEIRYRIDGFTGGNSVSYVVSTDCMSNHFTNAANSLVMTTPADIGSGDCIRYTINSMGEISEIELMVDYSTGLDIKPDWAAATENANNTTNIKHGYNTSRMFCIKKFDDGLHLAYEKSEAVPIASKTSYTSGKPTVTVYDTSLSKNRIRKGTVDDIVSFENVGSALKPIFLYTYGYYAFDIIVYK